MKQSLIFTLLLGSIFASTPTTKIEDLPPQAPKNVGHFIFPIGVSGEIDQKNLLSGYGGMGYQTKIRDASYIQSIAFEFGTKYLISLERNDFDPHMCIEACTYLPKISFIRYLNSKAENRLFFSAGPYLSTSCDVEAYFSEKLEASEQQDKKTVTLDDLYGNVAFTAGATFGVGIEFGHSNGALNILRLEYVLPIKHIEKQIDYYVEFNDLSSAEVSLPNQTLNQPVINITYAVGF